jgi:hypothetical protein
VLTHQPDTAAATPLLAALLYGYYACFETNHLSALPQDLCIWQTAPVPKQAQPVQVALQPAGYGSLDKGVNVTLNAVVFVNYTAQNKPATLWKCS